MDAELKAKWVEALRGGKFKQTRCKLKDRHGLCCIAVGYKVMTGRMPLASWMTCHVYEQLGLSTEQGGKLVTMNDFDEKNFPEIADYIEKNL